MGKGKNNWWEKDGDPVLAVSLLTLVLIVSAVGYALLHADLLGGAMMGL